jgi:hypothetical protein
VADQGEVKVYAGERTFDAIVVTVDGNPLDPRTDLKTFSENHFEWGYAGSESRQLALAILASCIDERTALRLFEPFMQHIVANFGNEWEINETQVQQAVIDLDRLEQAN